MMWWLFGVIVAYAAENDWPSPSGPNASKTAFITRKWWSCYVERDLLGVCPKGALTRPLQAQIELSDVDVGLFRLRTK